MAVNQLLLLLRRRRCQHSSSCSLSVLLLLAPWLQVVGQVQLPVVCQRRRDMQAQQLPQPLLDTPHHPRCHKQTSAM